MKHKKHPGLTVKQIKQAIKGQEKSNPQTEQLKVEKPSRPFKSFRKLQSNDNSLLLNLPFTSTRAAYQHPTPDWFTNHEKADISVIVPLYNNSATNLISSWSKYANLKVEFIFVDDNCPIDSKSLVVKEWEKKKSELTGPVGKIFCSQDKQGWPACCNIGAENATGDILIFMDPRTVLTHNCLKYLAKSLETEEVGAASLMQVDSKELTIADAGSEWSWNTSDFLLIGRNIYNGSPIKSPFKLNNIPLGLTETGEREKISSTCMAIKKELFLYYGGFSHNLFSSYWSDADFCMTLKEHGYKLILSCDSQVFVETSVIPIDKSHQCGKTYFDNKWVVSGRIDELVAAKRDNPSVVDSIVIRRRAAHGDVLMAASVVPAIKKKYPQAKVIFSTDCPEVLENNPWIDQVVEIHSERWFQLYFDLDMAYEYRPNANIMQAFADSVGVNVKDCDLFIPSEPFEAPENYVVIHAGKTLWAGRNWSSFKFDMISNRLKSAGLKVVCVGTWSDHKTTSCDLDLREKTTIPQLSTVIMNSKLFVGIDSFPMHIAQTFEVPGVCFFGSVLPETRLVNDSIRPIVAEGLSCLGCHHKKSTPCTATTTCDRGIQDCVNDVSVDKMWQIIKELL